MRPLNILHLYRVRLRARLLQEAFALAGIAAGVALLFASQVASSSLQSSVAALQRGIAGDATLQLLARGPHGMPASVLARVRSSPGVRAAAPVLEAGAQASGPAGSAAVELLGADESLRGLGGELVRRTDLRPFAGIGAVLLGSALARTVGVERFGQEVQLDVRGRRVSAPLYEQLTAARAGALAASAVVVAPLPFAQEAAGLQGRVSRVLVQPEPGASARVGRELRALAGRGLDVEGIGYEQTLFAKAAAPSNQSTRLFSVISALVGFLFAFNAVLLGAPHRRRLLAELRRAGYGARTATCVLGLDAVVLGLLAGSLGLLLGDEASLHVLHSDPAFLSLAFAVGPERSVSWQSVAVSLAAGLLASCAAMLVPLAAALPAPRLARAARLRRLGGVRASALGCAACMAGASAILLAAPDDAAPAMSLLVAAVVLALPPALAGTLALASRAARSVRNVAGHVATMELRAAGARPVAISATVAIAVFGSVAIEGAHADLLEGLEGATRELNEPAQLWIAPAGSYDLVHTAPFAPLASSRLARLPGVRSVRAFRGGLLDWGRRRVLVLAPPAQALPLLPDGQLNQAGAREAEARVREGGWIVLSSALAAELGVHQGEDVALPSPVALRLRVAALSTNLGWAPGAVMMNARDYELGWGSADVSAYAVALRSGVSQAATARELRSALGAGSGLSVQSAAQHAAAQNALSREALARLTQIAALIPIAAALAMAAAMGAMIWQRRPRLARLKLDGFRRARLWRTMLLESVLLLAVGCAVGTLFGLYGQQLADRALAHVVNFPVAHSLTDLPALAALVAAPCTALVILALPGYLAASVPASLALQDR